MKTTHLNHFESILANITLSELGLKWEKSCIDPARYDIEFGRSDARYSVWRTGRKWGTLGGSSVSTLNAAKALEEQRLKTAILEELENLEIYLRAFDVHARSVYEVKDSRVLDNNRHFLSKVAYRALDVLLTQMTKARVEFVLTRFPEIQSGRTRSIFANAITGFDIGDLKLMFVGPRITFNWDSNGDKPYALNGHSISLPIASLMNSSQVMKDHPGFERYQPLQILRLSERDLIRNMDAFIEQTFRVAQAVTV